MSVSGPLVLIEWEDSVQPASHWQYISELRSPSVVKCSSVGWLVQDTEDVKALAPNIGRVADDNVQASGIIQIPARCVVRLVHLGEG